MKKILLLFFFLQINVFACHRSTSSRTAVGECPGNARCDFDSENRIIRMSVDFNNDDRLDATTTYFYDENGSLSRADYDDQANGVINEQRHYFYHLDQKLYAENVDHFVDGSINERFVYLLEENAISARYEDFDQNGIAERVCIFDPPCENVIRQGECPRNCEPNSAAVPEQH